MQPFNRKWTEAFHFQDGVHHFIMKTEKTLLEVAVAPFKEDCGNTESDFLGDMVVGGFLGGHQKDLGSSGKAMGKGAGINC